MEIDCVSVCQSAFKNKKDWISSSSHSDTKICKDRQQKRKQTEEGGTDYIGRVPDPSWSAAPNVCCTCA